MTRTLTLRIDFFVTRKCTNRCVFCSESELMSGGELPYRDALRALIEERKRGAELVQFMGGEPTLHSRFVPLAMAAKRLGYTTFMITNGSRLADRAFCADAFPWLDEIMFSTHGWDAESHGAATRNPRSWTLLMAAMDNAARDFPGRILATTTVTSANVGRLRDIAERVAPYGVQEFQVISVVPSGRGDSDFARLHPRLTDMAAGFPSLIAFCRGAGIPLRFAGVPLCALGEHWELSHDLYEGFRTDNGADLDRPVDLWREPGSPVDWAIDIGRVKPPRCSACAKREQCAGLYALYRKHRGDAELAPFPA